jgi:hypothetical protein
MAARTWMGLLACLAWLAAGIAPVAAQSAALSLEVVQGTVSLDFAPAAQGRGAAAVRDAYLSRLAARECSAKRGVTTPVSVEQYADWLQADVIEWDAKSRAAVTAALHRLAAPMRGMNMPLPARVLLVRMAPGHMASAAYTRERAIYLPDDLLAAPEPALAQLLAHELFHVASRHDAAWRARMYALIGVRVVPELALPPALAQNKATNPDAPRLDAVHPVQIEGRETWVVPLLQLAPGSDALFGQRPFFAFIQLRFMEVTLGPGGRAALAAPEAPRLYRLEELAGFFERTGRNTEYLLHPEEILATNFMLLLVPPAQVATPQLLNRLRAALQPR